MARAKAEEGARRALNATVLRSVAASLDRAVVVLGGARRGDGHALACDQVRAEL